ncbi:hypothetical protein PSEUBRA_004886 [Kalmanozyma brasiliensis GHG001]|uniref:uncharacterized protein n=1 Tax=Kalmanozyma brasiliensis (strain GHG001) TaxID=1365824 RepID=UPI00286808D6|nr:uncharacterized protein PSEUBRA_004886 [Kalmanozyma brasiliensis GHG001]KAF6767451.1 hypothetical protein PSEUBRA_004886 [Kalmanozyma brasiliensis GHG001]
MSSSKDNFSIFLNAGNAEPRVNINTTTTPSASDGSKPDAPAASNEGPASTSPAAENPSTASMRAWTKADFYRLIKIMFVKLQEAIKEINDSYDPGNVGTKTADAAAQPAATSVAAKTPSAVDRDAEIRRLAFTLIHSIGHNVKHNYEMWDADGPSKDTARSLFDSIETFRDEGEPLRKLILEVEPSLEQVGEKLDRTCEDCLEAKEQASSQEDSTQ